MIVSSPYHESEAIVDEKDELVRYLGLKQGQLVQVWPTDSGSSYKDAGKLLSINHEEIVIEIAHEGKKLAGSRAEAEVRCEGPRWR